MAKGKHKGTGFEKFGNTADPDKEPPIKTNQDDDDDSEVQEPTDDEPTQPEPEAPADTGRGPVPPGAYKKLCEESMRATTASEQEQILAKMHPNNSQLRDPALDYQRCLTSGRSLPPFKAKEGTDPLLIRAKDLLERLLAGGLIVSGASGVYNQGVDLVTDIIKATGEPNAEPGQGSDSGNSALGS